MAWRLLLNAIVAVLFGCSIARAADIEVLPLPDVDASLVILKGEITEGDGRKFEDSISNIDKATVLLSSPGGVVSDALQIGATIRLKNFSTMVAADDDCFSACGLIWIAGVRRHLWPTSRIGFHAAYREQNGEYVESGVANAEIGSYLTHLGLRIEAIRFFTVAGPGEYLLLTPERARALGIEIFESDEKGRIGPADKPVVDVFAERFVSYSLLESKCLEFLASHLPVIKAGQQSAFNEGNALVSGETWVKLWLPMLDKAKADVSAKGALHVCLETEAILRAEGQSTGIDGPSFDCTSPSTPTEAALCWDPDLWPKDRAMNAIYFWIRGNVDKATRKRILAVQRDWLKYRNECGNDVKCLNSVYDQRLNDFKDLDISE